MSKIIFAIVVFAVIAAAILIGQMGKSRPETNDLENNNQTGATLRRDEAYTIAKNSLCSLEGKIISEGSFYNIATKTWWFDVDVIREGCSPACVVNVETKIAEMNWRCTGATPFAS